MNLNYNTNIPLAGNNPSVDQPNLQINTNSINSWVAIDHYYNNVITLRNVPDSQYLVECDAYLTLAAYLNDNDSIQYGYMSEYIARGAARKILSDTGDVEQLNFYEPMFREQELLVWKRSQRQWTATRTESIYSQGLDHGLAGNTAFGGGTI